MKHWCWHEFKTQEDWQGSRERRDVVLERWKTVTNLATPPSLSKTLISMDESWFLTYVMDQLGYVNDCYVQVDNDDGHIEPQGVPTERYKTFEAVE